MKTTAQLKPSERRRGVLLLLVLSMLTLFVMLGSLMLVFATRARTSARAFAAASNTVSRDEQRSRAALDEALMQLLRGSLNSGPVTESILADRYGTAATTGRCTFPSGTATGATGTANITGITGTALQLNGRVLTIQPPANDPAPVQSYRIVNFASGTATLANLRGAQPFVRPPLASSTCQAFINGRDFDNTSGNEPWDKPGDANRFLTEARLQGANMLVSRPAFGTPGQECQVDNDGDGVADGIWLTNTLPQQQTDNGDQLSFRVSYLVLDLDGRFNVNAHGLRSGTDGALGPASVSGSTVLGTVVWNRLLNGGTLPAASPPSAEQRRPTPTLGYTVDGRFGTLSSTTSQYDLRLDFDGPRPGAPSSAVERVNFGNLGRLFTAGEMERLMRPFDSDASALPPRLAGIFGDDAQKARMRITTDSWDTTGLVGQAASAIMGRSLSFGLPQETIRGQRFNINEEAGNQALFDRMLAVVLAAGAPSETATAQWVANAVDFRDADIVPTQVISGTNYAGIAIISGTFTGIEISGSNPSNRFTSIGQLLGVPRGSQQELSDPNLDAEKKKELRRSLAVDYPVILDAVMVTSPFTSTVAANPWREPGRVNVNTCDDDVWKAVLGESAPANPYSPAQSIRDMLADSELIFDGDADRPYTAVNVKRANLIANVATTRSNVFAVWVTVEITDSAAPDQKTYRRLFAIVDRSIPVGFLPGVNLNVRDTLRLVRYLE
jgi:hypothetical protein